MKTSFIGLGVMGYPMAGHMQKAGHSVTVYNRTTAKAERWAKEYGGSFAETPAKATQGADAVFMCVGNDDDVRSVVYGADGVLAGMDAGSVLVDHTTASADLAREIGVACADKGVHFLDAPVSGGQAGAENGVLTVMVGGEQGTFDRVAPVIDSYARAVTLLGPVGSGQLTKMVNQICWVGTVQSLAEAMNFALKAGLDAEKVVDVISKGAAQSWQMDNRALGMLNDKFDYGFAIDWARKDLGMCLKEADRIGAPLPSTALIDQFYAKLQLRGEGRMDTSALMRLLTKP